MTKFKSQALHIIRIKKSWWEWQPSLPHSRPLNIGILLHKHATRTKHFEDECPNMYIARIPTYSRIFLHKQWKVNQKQVSAAIICHNDELS